MKKALAAMLAALMVLLLAACAGPPAAGQPAEGGAEAAGGHKFGATYMTMNNPYFGAINEAIKGKVTANGDILITLDPALDLEKQISQIDDMIAQGIEVLFLNPVDWKGIEPAIAACREAGVLVVNVDAPVFNEALVDGIVASDNYAAGTLCARDMMSRLSSGGIALLTHPTTKSGEDRIRGFDDLVFTDGGPYTEIGREDALGQLENAMPLMDDMLAAHPDISAVMCLNDPTAQGAVSALKAAGYEPGEVLVYGVDGGPDAKKLVKEGWITATAAQSTMGIGAAAVEMAYKLLDGESVERVVLVDVVLITADNVDEFGTDGWQ